MVVITEKPKLQDAGGDVESALSVLKRELNTLRDPYLADALREFLRLARKLSGRSKPADPEQIVRDSFYICEVTRDATMRFLPYSQDHESVLRAAANAYDAIVCIVRGFELPNEQSEQVGQYAEHISERVADYNEAIREMKAS